MKNESFDKQTLIDYRLQRAQETLKDAHLLLEQGGSLWSVINRAYYAMFYAVLTGLTSINKGASKHSGVLALFDSYFVKPGHFPREMSKALHKAFELRQIGDYRGLINFERGQAEEMLNLADEFVKKIVQFFQKS